MLRKKMIVFTIMPLNDWNMLLEMFLGVNYWKLLEIGFIYSSQ
jgi:hypothetical protein